MKDLPRTFLGKVSQHLHFLDFLLAFLAVEVLEPLLEEVRVNGVSGVRGYAVVILRFFAGKKITHSTTLMGAEPGETPPFQSKVLLPGGNTPLFRWSTSGRSVCMVKSIWCMKVQ